jgi:2-oxoglutarate ferredoxin oxidoreductase subunit gamma
MIEPETDRTDIELYGIPSQQMADDNQLKGGSNIILLGKLLKETNICSLETMQKAIEKVVPPKKAALIPNNFKAIELGMNA